MFPESNDSQKSNEPQRLLIPKVTRVATIETVRYQSKGFGLHLIILFLFLVFFIYVMMIKEGCSCHAVERLLGTSQEDPPRETDEDDDLLIIFHSFIYLFFVEMQ